MQLEQLLRLLTNHDLLIAGLPAVGLEAAGAWKCLAPRAQSTIAVAVAWWVLPLEDMDRATLP